MGTCIRGNILTSRDTPRSSHFPLDPGTVWERSLSPFAPCSLYLRLTEHRSLAYVEMRLILARLIWNYDLVLAGDDSERFVECRAFNLWMKGPLNVRLIPVTRQ